MTIKLCELRIWCLHVGTLGIIRNSRDIRDKHGWLDDILAAIL